MKKGKKLLKSLMLGLLCVGALSTSSCGFFGFSQTETFDGGIESFYVTTNEDGTTTLTITYYDEDKEDDVFVLPAGGVEGVDGVSISMITLTQISATECLLRIYLNNSDVPYLDFIIPTGASIESITMGKTNTGSSTGYVTITYTDGTTQTVEVYYSAKGEAGFGILNMSYHWDEDGNIDAVYILWSNGDLTTIPITSYQGEDGHSITSITTSTDEENRLYHFYITYDYEEDDYPEGYNGYYDISFPMPEEPTTWYNGVGEPESTLGKDGDHYLDIKSVTIYEKNEGTWVKILSLLEYYNQNQNQDNVTITFDLNASEAQPAAITMTTAFTINGSGQYEVVVPYNTYFTSVGAIPMPTRSGYDNTGSPYSYNFMGWCTNKEGSPVGGYLNELTACNDNMTFYAIWSD